MYQSPLDEKWLASTIMTDDWKTLIISIGDSCDPVNRRAKAALGVAYVDRRMRLAQAPAACVAAAPAIEVVNSSKARRWCTSW